MVAYRYSEPGLGHFMISRGGTESSRLCDPSRVVRNGLTWSGQVNFDETSNSMIDILATPALP